jgi:hypothetical protein
VRTSELGGGGSYFGVRPPRPMAGMGVRLAHLQRAFIAFTTTASRYYSAPIYLYAGTVFAGAEFENGGSGDNGEKVKVAVYEEATGGGLGALAKNFGEATLTGAVAVRQIASAWTVPRTGWYYIVSTTDAALSIFAAIPMVTAVGPSPYAATMLPCFEEIGDTEATAIVGYYVAGTYANFPEATGLTLTNNLAAGATGIIPDIRLYR